MDFKFVDESGRLKVNFHQGQQKMLASTKQVVAVLSGSQAGKRLRLDEPIPTPRGFVPLCNLQIGDSIFDERGNPTTVVGLSPIVEAAYYRITFDDGTTIDADPEHQWFTQTYGERKHNRQGKVRTTQEIYDSQSLTINYRNHSIQLTEPVNYPEADLPIPPYTFGIWLGDGVSTKPIICVHGDDEEILEYILQEGVEVEKYHHDPIGWYIGPINPTKGFRLCNTSGQFVEIEDCYTNKLKKLGVYNNKHIPEIYLTGSINQRRALLAGLLDSDGYCEKKGRVEFTSTNHSLALGVLELSQSLGIKPRIKEERATLYGKDCGPKWRVTFSTTTRVFRLKRKAERQKNIQGRADIFLRYIRKVEPCGCAEMRCIEVDNPSHLYLASRSYVVTHNTSSGPFWMLEEMRRMGQGDYMIVAPTFRLMQQKLLPEVLDLYVNLLKLGTYHAAPSFVFEFSDEGEKKIFGSHPTYNRFNRTRIIFGHAQNPESLESSTVRAAWLDEAGQGAFKLSSFFAIRRRLSLSASLDPAVHAWMRGIPGGRILITTTPYNLGWLKTKIYDPWNAAGRGQNHPEIEIINFRSIDNPAFSIKEYERARAELPDWQFQMMYNGLFTRPAGMIYDSFTEENKIPRFEIPKGWPRFVGVDFGGVNTAAVFIAVSPDNDGYVYRTYHAGGLSSEQHVKAIKKIEPRIEKAYGGAPSEDSWRLEFTKAGLAVIRPVVRDVEVGINRVYSSFKTNKLFVFEDQDEILDELVTYSRELDDSGNPKETIADKNTYHLLDCLRYIVSAKLQATTAEKAKAEKRPFKLKYGKRARSKLLSSPFVE